MAAPAKNVRIKLAFDNLMNLREIVPPKAWYLIDFKSLDTIADLERDVIAKYALNWIKSIDFYVEGCLLPKWETIQLLRENDVIKLEVNKQKKRKKKSQHRTSSVKCSKMEIREKLESKPIPPSSSSSSSDSDEPAKQSFENRKSSTSNLVPKKYSTKQEGTITEKKAVVMKSSSSDSGSDEEEGYHSPMVNTETQNSLPQSYNVTIEIPQPEHVEEDGNEKTLSLNRQKRRRHRKRKRQHNGTADQNSLPVLPNGPGPNVWSVLNEGYNSPTVLARKPSGGHFKFGNDESEQCQVVIQPDLCTTSPMVTESVPLSVDSPYQVTPKQNPKDDTEDSWQSAILDMAENSTAFKPQQLRNSLVAGAKVYSREIRYKSKKDPNFSLSKAEQLSAVATNKSFFFKNQDQNGTNTSEITPGQPSDINNKITPATPKCNGTDYSCYPPLHNPPTTGQVIAYKIVEMSENYCPLVSKYKEAKVLDYNFSLNQLTMEIIKGGKKVRDQPGKFDIPEDTEMEENNSVTVTWSSLIDAKLVSE